MVNYEVNNTYQSHESHLKETIIVSYKLKYILKSLNITSK